MRILFNSSWYLYIGVVLKGESRFSPALFLSPENHALNELIIEDILWAFIFLGRFKGLVFFPCPVNKKASLFRLSFSPPCPVFPVSSYFPLRIPFSPPRVPIKGLVFFPSLVSPPRVLFKVPPVSSWAGWGKNVGSFPEIREMTFVLFWGSKGFSSWFDRIGIIGRLRAGRDGYINALTDFALY